MFVQIRLLLLCPLLFLMLACQQTQAAKPLAPAQGDLRPYDAAEEKVPMELWSPSRRKANASFYFLTGEYEALNRNMSRARKFLENAYNLDPNPFLAGKLIEARASEDMEQALLLAKKMSLLYPKSSQILLLYGRLLSATGQFDKAETQLRASLGYQPGSIEASVVLLQLLTAQQKNREAIPVAEAMLKYSPDYAEGWQQLTRLQLSTNQSQKALISARKAYDLDTLDPEKVHLYAVVLERNKNYKKAAELFDSILRLDPTNDDLIARMVGLYKQLGSLDEALASLKRIEKANAQESPGVRLQMAFLFWEMQKYQEASVILDLLAAKFPQSERVVYMSGLGQERTGQFEKAIVTYTGFDPSSDFFVHSHYRMIELYRKKQDPESALKIIREVIEAHVDRSVDFYPLGANILGGMQKFSEAVALLEEGYQKFPNRIDLLFLKAVNLEKDQKPEETIATLKQVIKKEPEHAAALNYLGYLYAERAINLDEAEVLIKKALELKPDDGYYLDSLGWVYYQQGHLQKALEVLLKANELVANESVVLEHLGETYEALNEIKKAIETYEKATKAKADEKDRIRILEKLERAKKKLGS